MSLNVARWRPAPLAPRSTGWGLWLAVLVLTLVGALASILAVAGVRSLVSQRAQWAGTITVAALGHGLETSDAAAARIEDLLKSHSGVASVTIQDVRADDALTGALMSASGEGTRAPRFMAVRLVPATKLAAADLATIFAAQGLVARLDDHRSWNAPVERAALIGAGGLALVVALVLIVLAVLATHAAHLGVRRVRRRMSLLKSLGATPGFLAAQFPEKIGVSALIGGVIGAVLAAGLMVWGADRFAHDLTTGLALDAWDYPIAGVWPLLAGLVGWVFGRLGAGGALRRVA